MRSTTSVGVIPLIALGLLGCAHGLYSNDDYAKRTPEEVGKLLLANAPIGSPKDVVRDMVKVKLRRPFEEQNFVWNVPFSARVADGDFSASTPLSSEKVKGLWFDRKQTTAYWLFSQKGLLKDLHVGRKISH